MWKQLLHYCHNMFLLLWHHWHRSWFAVLTTVQLLPTTSFSHDTLFLDLAVDTLRQVTVSSDAFDLWVMLEFLLQLLIVVHSCLLSWCKHSQFFRSIGLPQTNIHLIWATQNISAIWGPFYSDDVLHSLCMIHLSAVTFVHRKNADRLIEAGGNKFFPSGWIIHIKNSRHVIHMHHHWWCKEAHIKSI